MHLWIAQRSYAELSYKPTIAKVYNFHKYQEKPRVTPPQLGEEGGSMHVKDFIQERSFREGGQLHVKSY